MMNIFKVLSVSTVKSGGSQILKLGRTWITKPFSNWKKATAKMKEHAGSEGHILAFQTETAAASALREGSVLQQMHRLEECERLKNRLAIKSLLRCTHFLARNHIAHTTNFGDLVDLVVTCGGEDLKQFVDKAGKMLITPQKMLELTLLRHLAHGLMNHSLQGYKMLATSVCLQISVLTLQQ